MFCSAKASTAPDISPLLPNTSALFYDNSRLQTIKIIHCIVRIGWKRNACKYWLSLGPEKLTSEYDACHPPVGGRFHAPPDPHDFCRSGFA